MGNLTKTDTSVIHTTTHKTSTLISFETQARVRTCSFNYILYRSNDDAKDYWILYSSNLPICIPFSLITCKDTCPFMGWVTCRSSPWQGCRSRWQHWTGCGHTAASAVVPHVSDHPDTLQRRGIALIQPWWCGHVMTVGRSIKSC